jgi:hypothetical protein
MIFAAPMDQEGQVILSISPGHALSVLDTIALIPLLIGTILLQKGIWKRRRQLMEVIRLFPEKSSLFVFAAGLGLGLLLASAFSTFFWWWVVGALLFGIAVVIAVIILAKDN